MSSIAFLSASIFFFCAKLPSSSSESTSFFPLAFLLTTFFCDLLLPSPAPLIGYEAIDNKCKRNRVAFLRNRQHKALCSPESRCSADVMLFIRGDALYGQLSMRATEGAGNQLHVYEMRRAAPVGRGMGQVDSSRTSSLREGVHALASTDGSSCRDYLSCAIKAHDRNVRPKKWFLLNEICQHIRHAIRL